MDLCLCSVVWQGEEKPCHEASKKPGEMGRFGVEEFPYKKDEDARRKFWKEPLRDTKILFCGRGLFVHIFRPNALKAWWAPAKRWTFCNLRGRRPKGREREEMSEWSARRSDAGVLTLLPFSGLPRRLDLSRLTRLQSRAWAFSGVLFDRLRKKRDCS